MTDEPVDHAVEELNEAIEEAASTRPAPEPPPPEPDEDGDG